MLKKTKAVRLRKRGYLIAFGLAVIAISILLIQESSQPQVDVNIHQGPKIVYPLPGTKAADPAESVDASITLIEINLWPEYDQDSVLVIYKMIVSPELLKTHLTFKIPSHVDEINALAEIDQSGKLFELDHEINVDHTGKYVSFQPKYTQIQFEYYDPLLYKHGQERSFSYYWAENYSAGTMIVVVQQPAHAKYFGVMPDMGSGEIQSDGMKYYTEVFGFIDKNVDYAIDLFYSNPSGKLSY